MIFIDPKSRLPRWGSIYFTVVGVAALVTVIGLTAMELARVELEQLTARNETSYARILAQSGIDLAMARIEADPAWRTNYTSDVEVSISPSAASGQPFAFRLVDNADGDLADDASEEVEIQGIGRYGGAEFVYSALGRNATTGDEQVGPVMLKSYTNFDAGESMTTITDADAVSEYMVPSLPSEATSWSITSVDLYMRTAGAADGVLLVSLNTSNWLGFAAQPYEVVPVQESSLTGTGSWVTVNFTSVTNLAPGDGVVVLLDSGSGAGVPVGIVTYDAYVASESGNAFHWKKDGAWIVSFPSSRLLYRVRGIYTTGTGTGDFQITPGSWSRSAAP